MDRSVGRVDGPMTKGHRGRARTRGRTLLARGVGAGHARETRMSTAIYRSRHLCPATRRPGGGRDWD